MGNEEQNNLKGSRGEMVKIKTEINKIGFKKAIQRIMI